MAEEMPEMEDLSTPGVITKHKIAAEVVNVAMAKVIAQCVAGKKIVDICTFGDAFILTHLAKLNPVDPHDEEHDHGVAFPTCLSVNNCAGHFSPLSDDTTVLRAGDMLKIDLGAHVDGFTAVLAQTIFVPGGDAVVSDRRADVVTAAYAALQAAARMFRPGVKNTDISDMIAKVAEIYGVTPAEGVLSHVMTRYIIDGEKIVMNHPTLEQRAEELTVEENEVWGLDIVMSTGEGKPKDNGTTRPTVYKRNPDVQYLLKLKASRALLAEVNKDHAAFPFTLRASEDERRAKLGVTEMVAHGLLDPYPTLFERDGEFVAQCKTTLLVLPEGTCLATGVPPVLATQAKSARTEAAMANEALRTVMATPLLSLGDVSEKKKGKKKAKKAKKPAAAAAAAPAAEAPKAMEADKQ